MRLRNARTTPPEMPPPIVRVVLFSAYRDDPILYSQLPLEIQKHVNSRLVRMVEDGAVSSDFDSALVEMNPSPERVANHFKWRATMQVRIRLRIPRLPLELDLIRGAYPEKDWSRVDLSGILFSVRAITGNSSLIDFVGANGMNALRGVLLGNFPWASAPNIPLQRVVSRYRSFL